MANPPSPLIRYLRVQEAFERDLIPLLDQAYENANKVLKRLERDDRIGSQIRRSQIRRSQVAIKKELAGLWTKVGSTVVARREEAAAAAIQSLYDPLLPMLETAGARTSLLLQAETAFAQRNIQNAVTRVTLSQVPLSERVYRSQRLVNGQVDRLINSHIARGTSARELAKDVRQFIRPDTPGGVKYAAQRLGRTELNNAFHGTQVLGATRNPMITAMKWNLSGSHPKPDECNDYADGGDLGDGLWSPGQVPAKPHPNCLCYCTSQVPSREEFIAQYQAGAYDGYLDDIVAGREPPIATRAPTTVTPAQSSNPLTTRKNATLNSPAQWKDDRAQRVFAQPYYARETVGQGMLKQMFTEQGWDGPMDELEDFAFDAVVAKEGLKTFHRGVLSPPGMGLGTPYQLQQAFIHDDSPWVGTGFSGSGWYGGHPNTALNYADGNPNGVIEMAFKPGSRIIKYDDLTKEMNDRFDELMELDLRDFTTDHGMFATMLGYDAIQVNEDIFVLLNRSSVIVKTPRIVRNPNRMPSQL